jgi:hypothetical protein
LSDIGVYRTSLSFGKEASLKQGIDKRGQGRPFAKEDQGAQEQQHQHDGQQPVFLPDPQKNPELEYQGDLAGTLLDLGLAGGLFFRVSGLPADMPVARSIVELQIQ